MNNNINIKPTNISQNTPTSSLDKKKVGTSLPKKPFSQTIKKYSDDTFIQSDKTGEFEHKPSADFTQKKGLPVKNPLSKATLISNQPNKENHLFIQLDKSALDNKTVDKPSFEKKFTDHIKLNEPTSQILPSILMKPPDIIQPASTPQPEPIDQILPPQIIDKIVQQIRVGINEFGNTEFQFTLKSDVLGGLKLKVNSTPEGKISIEFITESIEAKNALEVNILNLENSLQKRGLQEVSLYIGSGTTSDGKNKYPQTTNMLPDTFSTKKTTDKPTENIITIEKIQSTTDYIV